VVVWVGMDFPGTVLKIINDKCAPPTTERQSREHACYVSTFKSKLRSIFYSDQEKKNSCSLGFVDRVKEITATK
jgi:hypothetical protein